MDFIFTQPCARIFWAETFAHFSTIHRNIKYICRPVGLETIAISVFCYSFTISSCHHPTLNWVTNTNWPISCSLKVWFGICSRMVALRTHFCTKLCFGKHSSVVNFILELCHSTYETGALQFDVHILCKVQFTTKDTI